MAEPPACAHRPRALQNLRSGAQRSLEAGRGAQRRSEADRGAQRRSEADRKAQRSPRKALRRDLFLSS
ncbi:hypothetical protein NDU88_007174 [Pleurodeles waltl]|uniref:Uncharacterized protein n=1 Tax=Pleurodeles waltl TaxID=8319 RepID=A0AAV7LU20_PLEWA|nr:hypothetical protein NDU88_007174 [Pleurodeles waltl]